MKIHKTILFALLFNIPFGAQASTGIAGCQGVEGPSLQVLGSGGPIADDGRASSGYLIWVDGRSRFLVDAGGGVFLRFGETGARFEDLEHLSISHFHTDHSADLVALLKSGYFSSRSGALSISGPMTGGDYPGTGDFLERLLDKDNGAYAYLEGYLDGSDGLVELLAVEVDPGLTKATRVYTDPDSDIDIHALGVPHGPVPSLAYRIRIGQKSIVFSGDQNGSSVGFIDFARDTDVLVMHMPIPENITGIARKLHAPPSVIGKIAAETGTGNLVLSHFMSRSLTNMEENLNQVRSHYDGPLTTAYDLDCVGF
ncbi:MAG: MBL fold metallo-hydrolase [Xanthomonadales bacterium]|nr:MBL fold metallo-hydrolase [Xanthomonadales bacterium]